ncbi:CaiB/BaiF CoA transferase family protein [Bordetella tumulicola]|uniref:CaiB/BaiF CoA transferase family protein n=1 Tax=Bordetella tumulicola TaxID=1649133 RepID=UPI0039F06654
MQANTAHNADDAQDTPALEGIRVIDVSRVLAAPFCGQLLADMGADVIKVEGPKGDENRGWPPFNESGQSCNFMSVNRGKRGITLNLKTERGRELLYQLLEKADVLIHNYLPEVAAPLGIDEALFRQRFPHLIVCGISAFGAHGPMRNRPGYDSLLQAFSGIMGFTGERGGKSVRSGVSFVDMTTGVFAYSGVLSALMRRVRTGKGSNVQVSLLETAIALLSYHGVSWLEAGVLPEKEGSGLWNQVPYQAFQCQDKELATGALNDATWRRMCDAIGRPDLRDDPSLATNAQRLERREEVIGIFAEAFRHDTAAAWTERLGERGVPVAPMHTVADALTHEQSLANQMVMQMTDQDGRSLRLLGMPFKIGHPASFARRPPPRLGEHTDEVLQELASLSPQDLAALRAQEVI